MAGDLVLIVILLTCLQILSVEGSPTPTPVLTVDVVVTIPTVDCSTLRAAEIFKTVPNPQWSLSTTHPHTTSTVLLPSTSEEPWAPSAPANKRPSKAEQIRSRKSLSTESSWPADNNNPPFSESIEPKQLSKPARPKPLSVSSSSPSTGVSVPSYSPPSVETIRSAKKYTELTNMRTPSALLPVLASLSMLAVSPSSAAPQKHSHKVTVTISKSGHASTTTVSLSIPVTQSASTSASPSTVGTVNTSLTSATVPFATSVPTLTTSSISSLTTGPAVISTSRSSSTTAMATGNIFSAIASDAPPAQIPSRGDHPVPRLGINQNNGPIETNKFYANFFLGSRSNPAWTHPYSVRWSKGGGAASSWGLSISHIEASQRAYGPANGANGAVDFFINPLGIQSVILSAAELGSSTSLTMDSLQGFSANVNLAPSAGATPIINFPLVQGMGFITGVYNHGTPLIQTGVFFQKLTFVGPVNSGGTIKYQLVLDDGTNWLLYATAAAGDAVPQFSLINSSTIQGPSGYIGSIQIAKNPAGAGGESTYDSCAGVWPVAGAISAAVNGASATYTFSWQKAGLTNLNLLMFALPHHMKSLSASTAQFLTGINLQTTTKGIATALKADSWDLVEELPVSMGFAPWRPTTGSQNVLSAVAMAAVSASGALELGQNISAQTDLNSMYYSGKALGKFAAIVYAVNDLAKNTGIASAGLVELKKAFSVFVNNQQIIPLAYDSAWGGVVSTASYGGDSGADFGNTFYNDHQFHYGYFLYAAAVIGYLDPAWLSEGSNKAWVNSLLRDYANPVSTDPYFPFSRSFDWYHGHSWAKGLFESGDGKDQESSSEDAAASFALKMWGHVIGDKNIEARGNLMLAIQARSFNNYIYYENSNTVEPANFIGNKVSGILFENKIDHTTYFGGNIEYVEGIHMLPLNPSSTLTRPTEFVQEEWNTYFSNGRVDSVAGGWRGILYANLAIIDPVTAFKFFANPSFDLSLLDGGASRTWYLAWCAGLGGA